MNVLIYFVKRVNLPQALINSVETYEIKCENS